jgi:hypothetical protein
MDIDDIKQYLEPEGDKIGKVSIRKPTAGTLSLCDFAQLKIASGGATSVPFYEAIAFFFIHSQPLEYVRSLIFDSSKGHNESGCSLVFVNEVIQWGDTVDLGSINEMGDKISELLVSALTPKVEPLNESSAEDDVKNLISEIDGKKK